MPLPKYPNPQFVSSRTQIISRRALQLEHDYADDDSEPEETSLERKDVEDLHAELDKIVSKRLKLKRVLDPSDETPPSKRRKESKPAGHQQGSEPVAFRLVSTWLPPRAIHLTPKPSAGAICVREPACEDTEEELRERVYRSTLSAVDIEHIERDRFTTTENGKPLRVLRASASRWHLTTGPLLLLEVTRATRAPSLCTDSRPSPHELSDKGVCCSIVSAALPDICDTHKKGKRRRRKNKNKLGP